MCCERLTMICEKWKLNEIREMMLFVGRDVNCGIDYIKTNWNLYVIWKLEILNLE
jgi:hypothetical protein